ncbi:uncharacterized protein C11orf24 homolog [Embiotoca jacksoni]|uniref:uncharacterized protein C11orf24 homolog n=1 Tax=Embiotoca jacksoni TaxID=100190 RepID=UPI003704D24C
MSLNSSMLQLSPRVCVHLFCLLLLLILSSSSSSFSVSLNEPGVPGGPDIQLNATAGGEGSVSRDAATEGLSEIHFGRVTAEPSVSDVLIDSTFEGNSSSTVNHTAETPSNQQSGSPDRQPPLTTPGSAHPGSITSTSTAEHGEDAVAVPGTTPTTTITNTTPPSSTAIKTLTAAPRPPTATTTVAVTATTTIATTTTPPPPTTIATTTTPPPPTTIATTTTTTTIATTTTPPPTITIATTTTPPTTTTRGTTTTASTTTAAAPQPPTNATTSIPPPTAPKPPPSQSASTRTPPVQTPASVPGTSSGTGTVTVPSASHSEAPASATQAAGLEAAGSALTRQLADTASLLAVLLFGLLFFFVTVGVFVTQAYESYRRKDYTQVDYLINGMYSDSGV